LKEAKKQENLTKYLNAIKLLETKVIVLSMLPFEFVDIIKEMKKPEHNMCNTN